MKLRDFFLPKIARSDPEVRKEAVRQEKDIQLVKKIIENDSDEEFASRLLSVWLSWKPQGRRYGTAGKR